MIFRIRYDPSKNRYWVYVRKWFIFWIPVKSFNLEKEADELIEYLSRDFYKVTFNGDFIAK